LNYDMPQSSKTAASIEEVASRQEIANTLAVHSRGVDRADGTLLGSAYHVDATVDYGFFVGPANQLVSILAAGQKGQPITLHRTSNMWIKVAGTRARSESYVIAYVEHRGESGATQRWIGGRYLDAHEERAGVWALTHRKYVMDFNINRPGTSSPSDPALAPAQFQPRGGQGAADAGRALLALYAAGINSQENSTVTTKDADAQLHKVLTRQSLHDLNMAYARAADRADAELMASVFHEDAKVVSGVFNCTGAQYARDVTAFIRTNLTRCFHSVANEWYEVRGDHAVGECYVIAAVTAGGQDTLTGGRYVDAYERRDGVWRITHRVFVEDWSNAQPTSHETTGMYAGLTTHGSYGETDPVYDFWEE